MRTVTGSGSPKADPPEARCTTSLTKRCKAIVYGVLDVGANEGWVNVGDDHDTPAFAVASIARWWERMGKTRYRDATRLMITADAGGSNSYRSRAFTVELAKLAATIGLVSTVCHMPPGTSK